MSSTYLSLSFPSSSPSFFPLLFSYLRNPLASGRASEFLATFHVLSFFSPPFVRENTWTDVIGPLCPPLFPWFMTRKYHPSTGFLFASVKSVPGESWFLPPSKWMERRDTIVDRIDFRRYRKKNLLCTRNNRRFKKFIGTRFVSFRLANTFVTHFFLFPFRFVFFYPRFTFPIPFAVHTYSTRI